MGVESNHKEYDATITQRDKCRDAFNGEDAIKKAGVTYLPRLSGQQDSDYISYKNRALFPEATSRTITGMLGQVFRKDPDGDLDKMEQYREDIDLGGKSLMQFAFDAVLNVLQYGRFGILADYSTTEGRPYLAAYPADSINNWLEMRVNGKNVPSMIVLSESIDEPKDDDEYEFSEVEQRRVLRLVDGVYQVEIWRKGEDDNDWVRVDDADVLPTRFGAPLDEIPFECVGPFGRGLNMQRSPILPLVNLNISIYRTSADLENGRHFCGCPTMIISGHDSGESVIRVGSEYAVVMPEPDAKAYFCEFSGQGLQALENAWEQKLEMMSSLGAYLLTPKKKAAESFEAKRIDAASEGSVLSAIVDNVSRAITQSLARCNAWSGGNPDVVWYELNKDFWSARMSAQDLTAIVAGWQAGAYDQRTMLYNLRVGELLDPEVTDDDIIERLAIEEPDFAPVAAKPEEPMAEPVE